MILCSISPAVRKRLSATREIKAHALLHIYYTAFYVYSIQLFYKFLVYYCACCTNIKS